MKKFSPVILLILLFSGNSGFTQESNPGNSRLTFIQILPYYQSWKSEIAKGNNESENISQLSNIFSINYPFSRTLALSLRGAYAKVSGDVYSLNGFCDSQLAFKYRLLKYNLVLDAGINIPHGKEKLSPDEFNTSRIISQNIFRMHVPNLGQGLNFYAGMAWAHPVSDHMVIGLGASYQVRGEYQPGSNDPMKYQPSDEFLLTGGLDYRLTENSSLSLDITGIFYGSDMVENEEIFSAGRRMIANLMYRYAFRYDQLSLLILYRDQALDELKGELASGENEKVNPNLFAVVGKYHHRISRILNLAYIIDARLYEETSSPFSGFQIYALGLEPLFRISAQFEVPVILKFYSGKNKDGTNITGFETGMGLQFWL
jgi:hypothetical protein